MRWAIIGAITLLLVAVAANSAFAAIGSITVDDSITLREGLQQAAAFVDTTANATALEFEVVPWTHSANIELSTKLRNNHSLTDHSDSSRFPNYNDCDSWRNLIDDGWTASTGVVIVVGAEHEAARVLTAIQTYWERLGHNVQAIISDSTRAEPSALVIKSGNITYRADLANQNREVSIVGTTECLPPT